MDARIRLGFGHHHHHGSGYRWISVNSNTCSRHEGSAVLAGHDADGSPLYVGRANYGGELMPCKVIPRHRVAYVSQNGMEIRVDGFEMYCRDVARPRKRIEWRHSTNGGVPSGAVEAGKTCNGEALFVGRFNHMGSLTPGKVHPSHGCCYIPFGGQEVNQGSYEVMVLI